MAENREYAVNVVAAKLHGLVGSPIEQVMGLALFEKFAGFYEYWWCRVWSYSEFQKLAGTNHGNGGSIIGIVPQFDLADVGRVDFALLLPAISSAPLVVVECDGHDYHDRTPEQASADRRRDRATLALGIPTLRYTGTDILRGAAAASAEIAEMFDREASLLERVWWRDVGDRENVGLVGKMIVPFQWPRTRSDGRINNQGGA